MAGESDSKATISISKVGAMIAATVGLLSLASSFSVFIIMPYRVNANEIRISVLEQHRQSDRENLIRLEERLWTVQNALGIKAEPPKKDR